MFGVNGLEFVLIAVIAVFVLGPDRMPEYAAKLAHGIRKLRVMAEGAKDQLKDQLGPEYEDINWRQYDPRQYDPRRIVKEALLDPLDDAIAPIRGEIDSVRGAAGGSGAAAAGGAVAAGAAAADGGPATYSTSVGTSDAHRRRPNRHLRCLGPPGAHRRAQLGPVPARRPGTPTRPERSAPGGREPERACRPGRGLAAPEPSAMPRRATAAGESGSPSTTGIPWSPPMRRRVSSGIWPSSGTSAPIARVSDVGDLLAAAGAEDLHGGCRRAARARTCSR